MPITFLFTHRFTNLNNGRTYYARVFTVNLQKRVNNRADLASVGVIPSNGAAQQDTDVGKDISYGTDLS